MIVSPPFLPVHATDQSEDDWIDSAMKEAPQDPELPGTFPVGFHLDWHGGMHLQAPADPSVRAIADGTVVFVRNPKPSNTDPKDPLNYNRAGQGRSWTDDGCVVVRHQTEIGANGSTGTGVSFHSIYMHLGEVNCDKKMKTVPPPPGSKKGTKPTKKLTQVPTPFPISRKELVGKAGMVYGNANRIHFEIVCDDTALQAILGRPPATALATTSDGRTDAVFGEMFFRIPAGQPVRLGSPVEAAADEIAARKNVVQAQKKVADAQAELAVATAKTPPSPKAVAKAQNKLHKAQTDLATANTDLTNAVGQANRLAADAVVGASSTEQFVGMKYAGGDCALKPAAGGSAATTIRGFRITTTRLADGTVVGTAPVVDEDAEYDLMKEAQKVIDFLDFQNSQLPPVPPGSAPRQLPSQSAVYELLRFGRTLGPDPLDPQNTPHWRLANLQITPATPPGAPAQVQQVWLDLNAFPPVPVPGAPATSSIQKFSDADLPPWLGWKVADDSTDQDSRCNAQPVIDILDTSNPPDGKVTPDEARAQLAKPEIRAKLSKLLCKFPTEWDAPSIDARWGWLKTKSPENPNPMDPVKDYAPYTDHVRALCIRRNTATTGATPTFDEFSKVLETPSGSSTAPFPTAHWHLHPKEFIRLFRKCGWLSKEELARVYPRTPATAISTNSLAVSQVLRRHGIINRLRASHFFGQGSIESSDLKLMMEGTVSFVQNPGHPSFQSEAGGYYSDPKDLYGFFHSYEKVGNHLGNMQRSELKDSKGNLLPVVLGTDSKNRPIVTSPTASQIDATKSHVGDGMKFRGRGFKQLTGLANYTSYWVFRGWIKENIDFDPNWWIAATPLKRVPNIPNPQLLSVIPFNCIDSGGQFAIKNGIPKVADIGVARANSDAVSKIVNRFDTQSFERRHHATLSAFEILGP